MRRILQGGKQALPVKTGCLPLNDSGNPGVNVDSYWEAPAVGCVYDMYTANGLQEVDGEDSSDLGDCTQDMR